MCVCVKYTRVEWNITQKYIIVFLSRTSAALHTILFSENIVESTISHCSHFSHWSNYSSAIIVTLCHQAANTLTLAVTGVDWHRPLLFFFFSWLFRSFGWNNVSKGRAGGQKTLDPERRNRPGGGGWRCARARPSSSTAEAGPRVAEHSRARRCRRQMAPQPTTAPAPWCKWTDRGEPRHVKPPEMKHFWLS